MRGRCWPSVRPRATFPCSPHAVLWIVAWYKYTFGVVITRSRVLKACSNSLSPRRKRRLKRSQAPAARLNRPQEGRADHDQAVGGRRADHGTGPGRSVATIRFKSRRLLCSPVTQADPAGFFRRHEEIFQSSVTSLQKTLISVSYGYGELGSKAVSREKRGRARAHESGSSASHRERLPHGYIPGRERG